MSGPPEDRWENEGGLIVRQETCIIDDIDYDACNGRAHKGYPMRICNCQLKMLKKMADEDDWYDGDYHALLGTMIEEEYFSDRRAKGISEGRD